jgi:hypothetical protein
VGGSSPATNAIPATAASAWLTTETAESVPPNAAPMSATVNAAAANASIRIRFADTDGWFRPARQRRTVTTVDRIAQWQRKATRYAWNHPERGSPAVGMLRSANVQIVNPVVSDATRICSRRPGGANSVANR